MTAVLGVPALSPCRACGDVLPTRELDVYDRCCACEATASEFEARCRAILDGANHDDDYYRVLRRASYSKDFCLRAYLEAAQSRGTTIKFFTVA